MGNKTSIKHNTKDISNNKFTKTTPKQTKHKLGKDKSNKIKLDSSSLILDDLRNDFVSSYATSSNPQSIHRNHKKSKGGIIRIYNAFFYSIDGIKAAFIDEHGFRQVAAIAFITLIVGLFFGNGFVQKVLLVFPAFLCVIIELFNSAIENAIDHTSLEFHPFAKKAKDMGSAAQMLGLGFLVFVWGIFIYEELAL